MSINVQPAGPDGDNNIEINIHPDAAKIVRVPENLAKRVAHLVLHQQDLTWAGEFLAEFESRGGAVEGTPTSIAGMALWHAALNSTMKCFGHSNARQKLDATAVFGDGTEDRKSF